MKICLHFDSSMMPKKDMCFCWETETPLYPDSCPCVHYETKHMYLPREPSQCTLTPCPYNHDGVCADPETHHGNSDAMCFANKSRAVARLALGIYGGM